MSDTNNPNPAPDPAAKPAKRQRADQDQQIANDIAEWAKLIGTASTDAEITPSLAERGYDAAEFGAGEALQVTADSTFSQRQTAWAAQLAATKLTQGLFVAATDEYVGFRELARQLFPEAAAQSALGVGGRVPEDLEKFISDAKASYRAAKTAPYAEKLTKRGYPATKLDGFIKALDALGKASADGDKAEGEAQKATEARDAAYEALKTWVKEFKATAKSALRKQPGQLKKLGL